MKIKEILDEIASESGSNMKMEILKKYLGNSVLEKVLYNGLSKRVKFYLKQIPEYSLNGSESLTLIEGLDSLSVLSNREKTGHDGIAHLKQILENLSEEDAYVIERIIEKDMKIGMGTSNVNKVFKDLIEKTPYMGAKSFSEKLAMLFFFDKKGNPLLCDEGKVKPAKSDVKMDGRYCNALIRGGEVELESRQGETTFLYGTKFAKELSTFDDIVLNGELTIDGVDRYTSNGIIASLVSIGKKTSEGKDVTKEIAKFEEKHMSVEQARQSIRFTCWDVITIEEYFEKGSKRPYQVRWESLTEIVSQTEMVSLVEHKIVYSYQEAMEHFLEVLARGEEGTILKSLDGVWKDGKPNHQMKMKLMMDIDLRAKSFNWGTGKNEGIISSINCESSCGVVKARVAGMTEDQMKYVTENKDEVIDMIIETQSCGLSQDRDGNWGLLHPAFKSFRDDKDTCDDLKSIQEIENMAKTLKTV
jgi:ATP-dependent DNA ligase